MQTNARLYAYQVGVDGSIQAEIAALVNVYPGSFVGGRHRPALKRPAGGIKPAGSRLGGAATCFDGDELPVAG